MARCPFSGLRHRSSGIRHGLGCRFRNSAIRHLSSIQSSSQVAGAAPGGGWQASSIQSSIQPSTQTSTQSSGISHRLSHLSSVIDSVLHHSHPLTANRYHLCIHHPSFILNHPSSIHHSGLRHPLDFPGDAWIMDDVPSQSDPANDRRLISGVFRIRFPSRYHDGMQRTSAPS